MLHPIKLICDPKKVRRDGTSLIYIQYCYSSENRTLLNSQISIPAKFWVTKNLSISKTLPPEFGDSTVLNEKLSKMLRTVEDLIVLADKQEIEDKGTFVKNAFKPEMEVKSLAADPTRIQSVAVKKPSKTDLFLQIDDYIASKEKRVSKSVINTISNLKKYLSLYENFSKKKLTFESFDFSFYESFIDFLTFEYVHERRKKEIQVGLKINTIGKAIKQLRTFINDRVRRKIIAPIDLDGFSIIEEETDAIYLSHDEIAAILSVDLTHKPYLIEYRDLLVLACLTGLRFSDFSGLKPEDLRNNRLYKKQEKSDHWVVIPMRREAKEIFTEQFKSRIPKLTNTEFNRHIKTIGRLAGITMPITFTYKKGNKSIITTKEKCDWITSHTARRSFCTNEFLAGTPVKLIMKISGHKNEKDFYRYIRITPEEAAMKIEELWQERGNMQAFPLLKSA